MVQVHIPSPLGQANNLGQIFQPLVRHCRRSEASNQGQNNGNTGQNNHMGSNNLANQTSRQISQAPNIENIRPVVH